MEDQQQSKSNTPPEAVPQIDTDVQPSKINQNQTFIEKMAPAADTFFLGGAQNVGRPFKLTINAKHSLFIYLSLLTLLVGLAFLHIKVLPSAGWLLYFYLFIVSISILNIIYFGWIKRELVFGNGFQTVKGIVAVGASFIYLFSIAVVSVGAWNYNNSSYTVSPSTSQQNSK